MNRMTETKDAPSVLFAQVKLDTDSKQPIPSKDQRGQDLFPNSHLGVAITDWLQQGPYPFIANHSTQQRQQIK
jgi:hypothetical protein